MYPIRKMTLSIVCLLTISILTSISTSALAQPDGTNTEETPVLSPGEASESSIPELRLRIKKLVQELQIKRRNSEQEDNSGTLPTPKDTGKNTGISPTPEAPSIPATPPIPAAPLTPEPPITPAIPPIPAAPLTPEPPIAPAVPPIPATPLTSEPPIAPAVPQAPDTSQVPASSPDDSSNTPEKSSTELAAPGQFEVDEESAQRALERTLVQSGALLLQSGQIDLETSLSLARNQQSVPAFINTDTGLLAASEEHRDSTLGAALHLRIGLPFESQLELGLPYKYIDSTSITRVGFQAASQRSTYDDGIGDIAIGMAKTLLKEKGRRPDLIARLSWDADNADTNKQEGSRGIGSGHNELSGSLTATKRQDPLIFTGNLRYEYAKSKHNTQPGESIGLTIGTVLAASPETSIRLALNQTFISETKVNHQKVIGSERVIASLSLGASSVLNRGSFLNASVDMGLTEEATDYSLNIAYIKRFTGLFSSR